MLKDPICYPIVVEGDKVVDLEGGRSVKDLSGK